jgi:hypothetical protein
MLEVEELKRAKKRTEVKLAMLETNMVKEPLKCKPTDPEKFKEGGLQLVINLPTISELHGGFLLILDWTT